ncbi:MAG: serine hydroxymethyltransferase [Leptospirales bacterium]
MHWLMQTDPEVHRAITEEIQREQQKLILIASENYVSRSILEAVGSVMTNKYAEGYPGRRYYAGCEAVDKVETLAIERAKTLFGAEHANVQPHSGSQANMAVYLAALKPGDTILGMDLAHGGHLTHGSAVSFSGHYYKAIFYGVKRETGLIDYEQVESLARQHRPRIIIAGASAYPRTIDFAFFRKVADEVGAVLHVDMAHFAGLVAAGLHPSPFPYADFVTTSTHKTLRGPRGGMAFCRQEWAKPLDKGVFPMMQGGPLMHVIAGKAVMLREASDPGFKAYSGQVLENARVLSETLAGHGYNILTGGTDNHLMLIDLRNKGLTGKEAESFLSEAGIYCNKNAVPFDDKPPTVTSGIRLGTPAITTRGFVGEEVKEIAEIIHRILDNRGKESVLKEAKESVYSLLKRHPIYTDLD